MKTETETQGWDTRFADSDVAPSAAEAASRLRREVGPDRILQDLLIAVRSELPFIQPEFLQFNTRLGQGSSFEVNKELFSPFRETPYFVAVKRILMRRGSGDSEESRAEIQAASRRLVNVMREVRVLTHPKLRSDSYLVAALGWGVAKPWGGKRPYLVMRYSEKGTLARFAQRRNVSLTERRLLAVDVAMGLRALHECNIVHGDVKPENVLVYDYPLYPLGEKEYERHIMAKLADFGCTLFEEDFARQDEYYLGTPKYNAPEICGWLRDGGEKNYEKISKFSQFKAADCYSFGLLLWETINNGKSKENALLDLATEFFRHMEANSAAIENEETESLVGVLPSNPTRERMNEYLESWPHFSGQLQEAGMPPDAKSFQAIQNTVSLCLQDSLEQRGVIHEIVMALSEGIVSDGIPPGGSSTTKDLPPRIEINGSSPWAGSQIETLMRHKLNTSATCSRVFVDKESTSSHIKLNVVAMDTPADPSRQIARISPYKRSEIITITPQSYCYGLEDMFKAVLRRQPPWDNQREAAEVIQRAVNDEQDPRSTAQAQFQLAVMCHVGYGVAPDNSEALCQLEAASEYNKVAEAIFRKVRTAFKSDGHGQELTLTNHITYKNPAVFHDGLIWRSEPEDSNSNPDDQSLTLGPINVASFETFAILLERGRYGPQELSEALTAACRDGHLDVAMILAEYCPDFSIFNTDVPNPLHWLIMFSPREAMKLLQALVSGSKGPNKHDRSKGVRSLLASEHAQMTILLPHRCMELRGMPLHWAVLAGYTELVVAFIQLGADVNARNQWQKNPYHGLHQDHLPSFSPLDLAVACHYPHIVEILLNHGSEVYGGDWYWAHSPFHLIGFFTLPFFRYMCHGRGYRTALRETIRVLLDRGLDINALDSLNHTPLFRAVKTLDLEPYILEELLSAGAVAGAECEKQEGNIVSSAIVTCAYRRLSGRKVPVLLPLAEDINARAIGEKGLNALQYCAFFDAKPAADALLQTRGININAENAQGYTAVSLAAQRGSLGVLASLIREGANLDYGDALYVAIHTGQIDAATMLVNGGASISVRRERSGKSKSVNILHHAITRDSKRPSYVRACLAKCPQLRTQEVLDECPYGHWTPLHEATYWGDVDGVRALLEAGADPRICRIRYSGQETPLNLATKLVEEATFAVDGAHINQFSVSHPFVQREFDQILLSDDYLGKTRRIELRFTDSLCEIIDMLRSAELERLSE
ncbi:Fc.00g088380.m01.CDS01 [Cosmosporella sp. VM-42]